MKVEQLHEPNKCRKAARNLFTQMNTLIDKAARTVDGAERRELYLQAMNISQQAYNLLGKAREISAKAEFKTVRN